MCDNSYFVILHWYYSNYYYAILTLHYYLINTIFLIIKFIIKSHGITSPQTAIASASRSSRTRSSRVLKSTGRIFITGRGGGIWKSRISRSGWTLIFLNFEQ